jgi:hypothetical protein
MNGGVVFIVKMREKTGFLTGLGVGFFVKKRLWYYNLLIIKLSKIGC